MQSYYMTMAITLQPISTSDSINVFIHFTWTQYDKCCLVLICEPQCVSHKTRWQVHALHGHTSVLRWAYTFQQLQNHVANTYIWNGFRKANTGEALQSTNFFCSHFHSRKTFYFSHLKYIFVLFALNIKLHNYTRFYVPSYADIFKIHILATFHR